MNKLNNLIRNVWEYPFAPRLSKQFQIQVNMNLLANIELPNADNLYSNINPQYLY